MPNGETGIVFLNLLYVSFPSHFLPTFEGIQETGMQDETVHLGPCIRSLSGFMAKVRFLFTLLY